jgi:hypothetical protein
MLTKFVVAFCVLALAGAAFAGSIPAKGATYHLTIVEPASVNGVLLKPGEYRVVLTADKVIFQLGKDSHEVVAKSEESAKKFSDNQIQYDRKGDQNQIKAICFGGTKTKLLFN